MSENLNLERAMNIAKRAVEAAAESSLRWFGRDAGVDWKADGSPVTRADREAEDAILRIIREVFPTHAILTEESGAYAGDARFRWIIDPLDGTHRFARGMLFWGPLVALEIDGRIEVGAMALPTQNQVITAASGLGCHRNGSPMRVSLETDWRRANLSLGSSARILETPARDGTLELVRTASYTVAGGDLNGAAIVLAGQAEAWIESGVKLWDVAPFPVMFEEAGGRMTDFSGGRNFASGHVIAANAALHEHVLGAIMRRGG